MSTSALIDTDQFLVFHDAVPTTIIAVPLPENSSAVIEFKGLARRASNGNTKSWFQSFTCRRGTGNATIIGVLQNLADPLGDIGALTWDISLVVDGDSVLVQCKGQTNADIAWYLKILGLTISDA